MWALFLSLHGSQRVQSDSRLSMKFGMCLSAVEIHLSCIIQPSVLREREEHQRGRQKSRIVLRLQRLELSRRLLIIAFEFAKQFHHHGGRRIIGTIDQIQQHR